MSVEKFASTYGIVICIYLRLYPGCWRSDTIMKLRTSSAIPVYTIAGEGTARPLPEWLVRKRSRSLKKDAEYTNRIELLQDFEFEEASQCVRVSDDGEWVVSTGASWPTTLKSYAILIADRSSGNE